ncbi:hypothetical protein RHMOL_Rhmol10G0184700 [Rhododendron molle]|uniref:Uncharacterized protein n=1 Tax=Rhododendron molle TaxID=49168 RepID=A0ACC0M3N1_RHOML|nr:hypothetical protein RHMOL_Rhmol10G0184700 [Rhododendron molle]
MSIDTTAFNIVDSSTFGLHLGIQRPRPPDGSLIFHFRALATSFFTALGLEHLHACSKLQNHVLFNDLPKLSYMQYRLKRHFILNKNDKLTDFKHQELYYWMLISWVHNHLYFSCSRSMLGFQLWFGKCYMALYCVEYVRPFGQIYALLGRFMRLPNAKNCMMTSQKQF